jgi:septal ring factor EnvC (AmiA/AmiB activator)
MNVATMMRRLEEGGFSPGQATALAEVLHDEVVERIATKEDLARLETAMAGDLARLETAMAKDTAHVEERLDRVEGRLDRVENNLQRFRDELEQKIDQAKDELEKQIRLIVGHEFERSRRLSQEDNLATIKWVAGMMIVQTVALLTGAIGLVKLLLV